MKLDGSDDVVNLHGVELTNVQVENTLFHLSYAVLEQTKVNG